MRALGVILLLLAAALWGLLTVDRRSPAALYAVEAQGQIPVPLAPVLGGLGLLALVLSFAGRRSGAPAWPAAAPTSAAPPRPAPTPASEGWLAALHTRARELPLETGAAVRVDVARPPHLILALERVTPERARRCVELYAELLATLPVPPRVAIHYKDCPVAGAPRQHQVMAALRRYFPADAFQVVPHEDVVDIAFRSPDPRWREEAARAAKGGQ